MKKRLYIPASVSLWIVFFFFSAGAMDPSTESVMPFVKSADSCMPCHKTEDNRTGRPYRACSTFCLSCHAKFREDHHPFNIRLKKSVDGMDLTDMKRISCFTCHDLDRQRYDNVSWKAESLFDSVFRRKKVYQTFYLTTNNREGGLCKKCH